MQINSHFETAFKKHIISLIKIIQERSNAFQRFFLLSFNFNKELNSSLCRTAQIYQ